MSTDEPAIGDHSVVIQILTWFLLTVTVLAYLARSGTKVFIRRTCVEQDDYFVTISLILSICQSASISISAIHGLGKPVSSVSQNQLRIVQQAQYASQLFWVSSLCFSRLAYLYMIKQMTPVKSHKAKIKYAVLIVVIWAIISLLVTAFQCHIPNAWNYLQSQCINRPAWFISLHALNAALDTALIALPTVFILSLQAQPSKKFQALVHFWIRWLVIAASICDAIFWSHLTTSSDPIHDIWPVIICTQIVQSLSIVTVSALYLKPFVQMLQSGFWRIDDMQRRGSAPTSRSQHPADKVHDGTGGGHRDSRSSVPSRLRPPPKAEQVLGTLSEITAERSGGGGGGSGGGERRIWERESQARRANIIVTETTFTMQSEPRVGFTGLEETFPLTTANPSIRGSL